jgi:putative membrane protein
VAQSVNSVNEMVIALRSAKWMFSPLNRLAIAGILIVALQHLAFFVLETFLWQSDSGRRIFRMDREKAAITAPLAANQGVYNGFLAAGLLWGLWIAFRQGIGYVEFSRRIEIFFLTCVAVAGVVGGLTVNRRIFFVQALPALVTLLLVSVAAPLI